MTDSNDILERLKNPEREQARRRPGNDLFLRNILNSIFMLLALVAMVGIAISWDAPETPTWCYVLGLLAVVVKMIEAMLRLPGIIRKPREPHFSRRRREEEEK